MYYRIPEKIILESDHHRHIQLSSALIEEASHITGSGHVAILGCGRCAEIPIFLLHNKYKRIHLVEIDSSALDDVKIRARTLDNKISFYCTDLTGLSDRVEPEARQIVNKAKYPKTCLNELGDLLVNTKPIFWRPADEIKNNLVICSTILTQLPAVIR